MIIRTYFTYIFQEISYTKTFLNTYLTQLIYLNAHYNLELIMYVYIV